MRALVVLLLLLPFLTGAWTDVGTFHTDNEKVNDDTLGPTAASTATVEVGNVAICVFSSDNDGSESGTEHTSVSDSAGNNWVKRGEQYSTGNANGEVVVSIWTTVVTTQITVSSTTLSFVRVDGRSAKAASCREFTISTGDSVAINGTPATEDNSSTNDPAALAPSGVSPSQEYLWIRAQGIERNTETMTATTSFTRFPASANCTTGGGGASNVCAVGEFRIFTGTTLTSDPSDTAEAATGNAGIYMALEETTAPTGARRIFIIGQRERYAPVLDGLARVGLLPKWSLQ